MGIIIAGLELLQWGLKVGETGSFIILLLVEVAMITILWISGKQNVFTVWRKPYGYARSLGFIALTLVFAGIIRGTGLFVLNQWLEPGYYTEIIKQAIDEMSSSSEVPAWMQPVLEESQSSIFRYMHNPFWCMLCGVFSMFDILILFVLPVFLRQITPKNTFNNE